MTGIYLRLNHNSASFSSPTSAVHTGPSTGSFRIVLFCLFFGFWNFTNAQESLVRATVDTNSITIGEQLNYRITVETSANNQVVFPEGETFNPLEFVEALSIDTTRMDNRLRLIREYSLTQFDSGSYTIPPQRILINELSFLTDSLRVEVFDVVVDTTKQKMYAIKPAMEVPSSFNLPTWLWWLLALLIVAGVVFYFFRRRKKKQEAQKQLPPYERALFELQQLDQSHLLENRQTKEYYSKLTEAVRRYLEDEVHLRALESTTSELIAYLEVKTTTGELKLSKETIEDLKIILQRADLAKFANSRPDVITAKGDRSKIENVINDTKAAIPEPTEEELLKDVEYRRKQLRRKNRRKLALAVGAGLIIILLGITALISTQGISYVQDALLGNPTRELLEGEWISSEYGDPAVTIATPRVLVRGEIDLSREAQAMMVGSETFIDGTIDGPLYVVLSTVKFQQGVKFDLETAVDGVYANLEQKGARNMIVKDEPITTLRGAEGIRVFGTLELEHPVTKRLVTKEYLILNFAEKGGFQQITIIYNGQDPNAGEIANRIYNSVEFENPLN